jgi:isochorismate hydrolase
VDQSQWFVHGKVWEDLMPQPDDVVIHKPSYGAFYDTPLETILKNLSRDTISFVERLQITVAEQRLARVTKEASMFFLAAM